MRDPCARCGHGLRSEVLAVGAFRVVAYFDGVGPSNIHTQRITHCPSCGVKLGGNALDVSGVGTETFIHPSE